MRSKENQSQTYQVEKGRKTNNRRMQKILLKEHLSYINTERKNDLTRKKVKLPNICKLRNMTVK